jgi:ABC-type siderophore export system fused ATPase/permease subunit
MKFEKILLIGGIIIVASLALKSIKQLIYLSFTLLSLKVVWILLIILFILKSFKKRTQPSRETAEPQLR